MTGIAVRDMSPEFSFGSIITGVTQETLADPAIRRQIVDLFEDRGMIIFAGVEPSQKMHVAISNLFGPLKDHPVPVVPRVDQEAMPGVIDMHYKPGGDYGSTIEIDGKPLAKWSPWHFDHCYNDQLNRAGILRALIIPPDGGLTGFADGVEMYETLSPALRDRIEGLNVIYTLDTRFEHMRFGRPKGFKPGKRTEIGEKVAAYGRTMPRAIHPMVWQRGDGRKVLHVSPWMAVGIEGHETPEGDALLEQLCQEMIAHIHAYRHRWKPDQMLIWDNWRMLHNVSGNEPQYERRMQRTTILGDYGLGRFEGGKKAAGAMEMA